MKHFGASPAATATIDPSGDSTRSFAHPFESMQAHSFELSTSQKRIVSSALPETRYFPSLEKDRQLTLLVCPCNLASGFHERESHIARSPSLNPAASLFPS